MIALSTQKMAYSIPSDFEKLPETKLEDLVRDDNPFAGGKIGKWYVKKERVMHEWTEWEIKITQENAEIYVRGGYKSHSISYKFLLGYRISKDEIESNFRHKSEEEIVKRAYEMMDAVEKNKEAMNSQEGLKNVLKELKEKARLPKEEEEKMEKAYLELKELTQKPKL